MFACQMFQMRIWKFKNQFQLKIWLCGLVLEIGGIKDTCDPKLTGIDQSRMKYPSQTWIGNQES